MQKIFALTLLLVAVALGQSRTTINYVNASTITGSITNILNDGNALAPVIYAIWVPENAGLFTLTLTNTNNDDCSYVDYSLITDAAPCYEDTFGLGDADRTFCNLFTSYYSGSYSTYTDFQPGQGSYYFKYQTGKYIYVGVATESAYTAKICTFTLKLDFNTTCATGSAGTYTGDDFPTCVPVTSQEISNFTVTGANVNTTNFAKLYEFTVPVGTAFVQFVTTSSEYNYLYGSENAPNSGYSGYDCYNYASSNNNLYTNTLTCYTPEAGKFYTYFELTSSPNNDNFNYTFTSSIKVCPNNMIGENCEWPAQALNISGLSPVNLVIPYNGSYENYAFLYLDVPANNGWTNNVQLNYYLNNVSNSEGIYVDVTKGSIALDDVYRDSTQQQYTTRGESDYWVFSWQDWVVPSRIYIGFQCYNGITGGNCNVSVSFNSSSITTSGTTGTTGITGVSTTGTTGATGTTGTTGVTGVVTTGVTGVVSTTSGNVTIVTTSSASAIVASFALVLVAALF